MERSLRSQLALAILLTLLMTSHADAKTFYSANLDASQVLNNESFSTATGTATFELNDAGNELSYTLALFGLDLVENPDNRTDPNDVVGIHVHLHVPDVIGPHILNIFGIPGHDDADLVVDYDNETLSGIYDISDASRDPDTGEILPQNFPLTTKIIDNWIEELNNGELYIAVHSRDRAMNAPPGVDIRGNISIVPEPSTTVLLITGLTRSLMARKRRNYH